MNKLEIEVFGTCEVMTANGHTWAFPMHEFVEIKADNALEVDAKVRIEIRDIMLDKHMFARVIDINPQYLNPFNYEDN